MNTTVRLLKDKILVTVCHNEPESLEIKNLLSWALRDYENFALVEVNKALDTIYKVYVDRVKNTIDYSYTAWYSELRSTIQILRECGFNPTLVP